MKINYRKQYCNGTVFNQSINCNGLIELIKINNAINKKRKTLISNGVITDIESLLFLKPFILGNNYTTVTQRKFFENFFDIQLKERNTIIQFKIKKA